MTSPNPDQGPFETCNLTGMAPGAFIFDPICQHLCVKCGDRNLIFVEQLKVEGKKEMSALDFANGFNLRKSPDAFTLRSIDMKDVIR